MPRTRTAAALLATLLVLTSASAAEVKPPAAARGQRVFVAGHSFHVPIAAPLAEITASAGLAAGEVARPQSIGGSTVTQHWDLPDDRNRAKSAVRSGEVDVLTLSPYFLLPDPAIDRFTDLLLAHNPAGRVTVQASWVPRDGVLLGAFKNAQRDAADAAALRRAAGGYMDLARAQVRAVNDRHAAASGRPVAFLVPVGEAVVRLRERVARGEVPGVARQSDLFRDDLGHGREAVNVLNAYCHFAVIYGRSPVGLPAPAGLAKSSRAADDVAKVNRVLQEIAWEAVLAEPASGVKGPAKE